MNLKDKSLEYIEKLCIVYENGPKEDLENTQKIIDQIYTFAHCVQEDKKCYPVHEDRRKELKQQNWHI